MASDLHRDISPERAGWERRAYGLAQLPYHLKHAGEERKLENLLFSYSWLEKKIPALDANAAMADYELLSGSGEAVALREALLLSRSVLTEGVSQLASQLHGRLADHPSVRIGNLLEEARAQREGVWLRPLTSTFQGPKGPLLYSFQAHRGEVRAIIQLDEERFATAATDGKVKVWDFASGDLVVEVSAGDAPVRHLAGVTPNRLLAASDDGIIRLWDLKTQQALRTFEAHSSPITALRRRQGEFFSGADDGTLLRWSLESDHPLGSFEAHGSKVNALDFLDAETLISAGKDRTLRICDIPSGRLLKTLTLPVFAAESLQVISPAEVLLGTFAGQIQIWAPMSQETKPRHSFKYRSIGLDSLCLLKSDLGVSPVGGLFGIQLWNPRTGPLGPEIHVPGGEVTALSPFGSHLLCGSKEGRISAWIIERLQAQRSEQTPVSVYSIAVLDATTAASSSDDGSVHLWNALDGRLTRTIKVHSAGVSSICPLENSRVASSASGENAIRVWDARTGESLTTIQCPWKPNLLAAFGGNFLFVAPVDPLAKDQTIQFWDVGRGQKVGDLPDFPGGVGALRVLDDRFLLIGTFDGPIFHLDISTASDRRNFTLKGHEKGVVALALLGSRYIASGSLDQTIRLWDLRSQETIRILTGHEREVTGLAVLSPRFLASASQDHSVKIWDLETGTVVASLLFDTGLSSLATMPDGGTLVAGDTAGTVHFLRVEGLDIRS